MPHTSDNDKKAKDNNALRHEKNMMREKTAKKANISIVKKQITCKNNGDRNANIGAA